MNRAFPRPILVSDRLIRGMTTEQRTQRSIFCFGLVFLRQLTPGFCAIRPAEPIHRTTARLRVAGSKRVYRYGISEPATGAITTTRYGKLLPTALPLLPLTGRLYPTSWRKTTWCAVAPAGPFLTSWDAGSASPPSPHALCCCGPPPVCAASEKPDTGKRSSGSLDATGKSAVLPS